MYQNWRIQTQKKNGLQSLLFFAAMVGVFVLWIARVHAYIPYFYTFEYQSGDLGKRKIVVDFEFNVTGLDPSHLAIEFASKVDFYSVEPKISAELMNQNLHIRVLELDRQNQNYNIVIKPGALAYEGYQQLDTFVIPFSLFDIEPGFRSTFVSPILGSESVNALFKQNAPRDISIVVPKLRFKNIKTLHRYKGLAQGTESPNLTNIDISADEEVNRIDVSVVNKNHDYKRVLYKHPTANFFTTGHAGLGAEGYEEEQNEIVFRAYDAYGRNLENRQYKLQVKDPVSNFTKDDYINEKQDVFGKTYTLYQLMEDPKLLEDIISVMSVGELDKIGVHYKNVPNIQTAHNANDLAKALADTNVSIIRIGNLELSDSLVVARPVTLDGLGSGKISFKNDVPNPKVQLGVGDTTEITLKNISIHSDLEIDVGNSGKAHLQGVTVGGTTSIKSGGVSTIVLEDFKTSLLNLENEFGPVRVVFKGTKTNVTSIRILGSQKVTLDYYIPEQIPVEKFTSAALETNVLYEYEDPDAQIPVTAVSVSPYNHSMAVGQTVQASAWITPTNATDKTLVWSSSTPQIGVVDSSGLFTALSAGSTTLSATAHNGVVGGREIHVVGVSAISTSSVGEKATLDLDLSGTGIRFTAKRVGVSGNDIEVVLVSAGALGIEVSQSVITISAQVGETTVDEIVEAMASHVTASALVSSEVLTAGAIGTTSSALKLSGGQNILLTVHWEGENLSVNNAGAVYTLDGKAPSTVTNEVSQKTTLLVWNHIEMSPVSANQILQVPAGAVKFGTVTNTDEVWTLGQTSWQKQ
jgi:hypothetical protein